MLDEYGYICTAPCPTLDEKGLAHCRCIDPGRAAVCPCGHSARWEEKDLGVPVRPAVPRAAHVTPQPTGFAGLAPLLAARKSFKACSLLNQYGLALALQVYGPRKRARRRFHRPANDMV